MHKQLKRIVGHDGRRWVLLFVLFFAITSWSIAIYRVVKQMSFAKINYFGNWLNYLSLGAGIFLTLVAFYLLVIEILSNRKIYEELRIQQEYFHTTINSIAEGLITTGKKGEILYMNAAAERLTGWRTAEARNLPLEKVYDVVNEASGKPFDHIVSRILKTGRTIEFENNTLLQTRQRNKLVISNNGSPIFDARGNISGTVLVFNDISEKKKIENQLKESEKKYKDLVEQAADGIFLFDREGNFVSVNTSGCRMLGYPKADLLSRNLIDIIPPGYIGRLPVNLEKLNSGTPVLAEREFMRMDGTVFFTEVRAQITSSGYIQAVVRDITDRKKATENLLKAIERYDILAKATSDTIWDWDIDKNRMLYNDGMSKMFGYETSEVENVMEWWKRNIHPDDQPDVSASLDEVFTKKLQHFQLTYRFRCDNGSFKYIFDRAFVIFDNTGKPVRMIGAMQDITYQKEEEIRIAKATLKAQENERHQIGIELHDNVNQILVGALLSLGMVKQVTADKSTGFAEKSKGYITDAIEEIRKLSHRLAPASMHGIALKEIFENLIQGINIDNHFRIKLYFEEFAYDHVTDEIQINLYRILQEQLNNIIKHANATVIRISVTKYEAGIRLSISDNGRGFDPNALRSGIGLSNIKKRVESFYGKFKLFTAPGQGCEVVVEIPVDKKI